MTIDIRQAIQQATAAFQGGDYAVAESLLDQVVERAPRFANVYNMLGVIASQRGAVERAVAMFRQALVINPGYSEAQINLAITLAEMGAYEQASQEVAKLHAREPAAPGDLSLGVRGKLANAHADLAKRYHELALYPQAIAEYDKALALCPSFPDLHSKRGVACRDAGELAEARDSLLRALELNPKYAEAYVNLGLVYRKMGKSEDAAAMWERALEIAPQHALARIYLNQARSDATARG
ncbi:MAG: tetratricopeptide repeat protein [Candidatus Methylomirabilota bacterium]